MLGMKEIEEPRAALWSVVHSPSLYDVELGQGALPIQNIHIRASLNRSRGANPL